MSLKAYPSAHGFCAVFGQWWVLFPPAYMRRPACFALVWTVRLSLNSDFMEFRFFATLELTPGLQFVSISISALPRLISSRACYTYQSAAPP